MANIEQTYDWPAGVYQWADGDVLDGGADSAETLPIRQLGNRSLFQRLANVTPWDSALAITFGYPVKACVMHKGLSWRSKMAANNIEPGMDPAAWERWGYSESELEAFLASQTPASAVLYTPQTLTDAQKAQARANIDAVPAGLVSFFASATPPTGYLSANGAQNLSRTVYAQLFAAVGTRWGAGDGSTTFGILDLRGEFIRGFDGGRGIDPSRVFGSWQKGSLITYDLIGTTAAVDGVRGTADSTGGDPIDLADYTGSKLTNYNNAPEAALSLTGWLPRSTRPRNIALLPCIKY